MRQLYMSLVVAILLGVCPVGAAVAADQDFAKITCKDFVNASEEQMGMMLMWIDGYMSGKVTTPSSTMPGLKSSVCTWRGIAPPMVATPSYKPWRP